MKLKKEDIKDSIFIVLFALGISAMAWYTDYTLVIFHITIPQWLLPIIAIALVIGWFILVRMPDKFDENGDPLKPEDEDDSE